ncbi:phosphoenolpyruvate--protein phosphotransferase [Couchioplanes caeruleus]|uniref:phosphoenolpyruvate--protein phosphotransferase n=1 Tax=Couchioplanes caeruleus TaxID=56438 RepID=UPI00201C93D2|nr:phosphoenolpyruvate--protein phosphotransferase [Couchioplanes caeruleus]UQU64440.1 phosphoenolpyruvate--protein phosphotransferase [Couchioplanes caeruleus]
MPDLLRGLGASAGAATGPAYRLADPPRLPAPCPVTDPDAEVDRAYAAIDAVCRDISRRAAVAADETAAEILRVQAALAGDRTLRDGVAMAVRAGHEAPHAVASVLGEHRAALLAAGGLLAARAADLDDLRDRMVAHCLGLPMPALPEPGCPFVLVAVDLAPADAALLDPARVLAVVTSAGSFVSHTAILARARGLPTVVACGGALEIADGTVVTVDGTAGRVTVGRSVTAPAEEPPAPPEEPADLRGRTADGHHVALLANIGCAAELAGAAVEGVGLFRTELLFQHHIDPPTTAEQIDAYAGVFAAMPGRQVIVRTLDAGADKPLPFLRDHDEPNPALGIRGLRVARRRADILRTQIAAIAAAARASTARVAVMAPMVTTVSEAAQFTALCRDAGLPTVGVMIEVPAAAVRSAEILQVVDFLSVGTNDLSQYAFAADRRSGELADLLDPWQPALLSLIALCAAAGAAVGRPVGVCGEAAADPAFAVVLAGLGVTSLSMSPPAVPAVRAALAAHTLEECRQAAQRALAAADPAAARAAVTRL